jgi:hypothetical protein
MSGTVPAAPPGPAGTRGPGTVRRPLSDVTGQTSRTAWWILPGAMTDDPRLLLWAYPPAVDLRIIAEESFDGTPNQMRMLDDYIDLAPLGPTDRGQLREMAVTVTAPLVLAPTARRDLARQAFAYMARQFGFLDTPDWLLGGGWPARLPCIPPDVALRPRPASRLLPQRATGISRQR